MNEAVVRRHSWMKPNAFAVVNNAALGYSHIGEIMSFPFAGKVQVRRVPGHPGTLEERLITDLEVPTNKIKYVHYAVVANQVQGFLRVAGFPVDMLRRDWAAPVNFKVDEDGVITSIEGDELMIAQAVLHARPMWSVERWASFGWSITHRVTEKLT